MAVTLSDSYGSISDNTVKEFERQRGITLPQSYKKFLMESNGGKPNLTIFDVPGWPGTATAFDSFFGIHNGKHNNLAWWHQELRDRLRDEFLAIGIDMGGNYLCLGLSSEVLDQVWYWDSSWDYDLKDGTMFKLADNITGFLALLRETY